MISENLRLAYEAGMAAGSQETYQERTTVGVPMTREVKNLLAEQVKQQIEADQQSSIQPTAQAPVSDVAPAALNPKNRVFVVSTNLDVTSSTDGQNCTLTPGDVVQRSSDTVGADGKVAVAILSAKSANCTESFQTAIDLGTLQDMHNQFRENIAAGLGKLATSSGSDGLPVPPPANPRSLSEGQATPDEQANTLLMAQFKQADQSEEEVRLTQDSAI